MCSNHTGVEFSFWSFPEAVVFFLGQPALSLVVPKAQRYVHRLKTERAREKINIDIKRISPSQGIPDHMEAVAEL